MAAFILILSLFFIPVAWGADVREDLSMDDNKASIHSVRSDEFIEDKSEQQTSKAAEDPALRQNQELLDPVNFEEPDKLEHSIFLNLKDDANPAQVGEVSLRDSRLLPYAPINDVAVQEENKTWWNSLCDFFSQLFYSSKTSSDN